MAEIIDLPPRQTELAFPPRPAAPRASVPRSSLAGPSRPRRGLAPQTRRLEISPEAFVAAESGGVARPETGTRREGLLETVLVLLATVAFGLAWVVVEQGRVEAPTSGYDPAASDGATDGGETWTNAIDVAVHGSSKR